MASVKADSCQGPTVQCSPEAAQVDRQTIWLILGLRLGFRDVFTSKGQHLDHGARGLGLGLGLRHRLDHGALGLRDQPSVSIEYVNTSTAATDNEMLERSRPLGERVKFRIRTLTLTLTLSLSQSLTRDTAMVDICCRIFGFASQGVRLHG